MILTTKTLRAMTFLAVAVAIGLTPFRAEALRYYDGEVTPAVIITGTDQDNVAVGILENEAWVVMRKYGIELGIRGRQCYEAQGDDSSNTCPNNLYPTNKDGTFDFEAGSIPNTANNCPIYYGPINATGGPTWCIDYSINVNYDEDDDDEEAAQYRERGRRELWSMEEEEEPKVLTDFVYQLSLDADPSCTTNSSTWDPINDALDGVSCLEAFYMGDNDTPSGDGTEVFCDDDFNTNNVTYSETVMESSVAQQTINYVLLTDPVVDGGYPAINPNPVGETFNPDTTPATYSITLKAYCRGDDDDCKRKNTSGGGKTKGTGTTGTSGSKKNSKGGKTGDDDAGKSTKSGKNDNDKTSKGTKNYDDRYGLDRQLYSQDDYHFKDDDEEGPVEIASVTVHFLVGGGEGTDTDGDGICDSQDIWGNCPDPEEECKYGYLEIDGCETMACKDACLISDWVYNCEKYEHDCDDYLTCVETGANAAAANGFITREQSGSVKECACHADVCKESGNSKSKNSKGRKYYGQKKDYDEDKVGDRRRRRKSNKARRLNEPAVFEFDSSEGKPTSSIVRLKIVAGGQRDAEVSTDMQVRQPGFDHRLFL